MQYYAYAPTKQSSAIGGFGFLIILAIVSIIYVIFFLKVELYLDGVKIQKIYPLLNIVSIFYDDNFKDGLKINDSYKIGVKDKWTYFEIYVASQHNRGLLVAPSISLSGGITLRHINFLLKSTQKSQISKNGIPIGIVNDDTDNPDLDINRDVGDYIISRKALIEESKYIQVLKDTNNLEALIALVNAEPNIIFNKAIYFDTNVYKEYVHKYIDLLGHKQLILDYVSPFIQDKVSKELATQQTMDETGDEQLTAEDEIQDEIAQDGFT